MIIKYWPGIFQDTIANRTVVIQDTLRFKSDSISLSDSISTTTRIHQDSMPAMVVIHDSAVIRTDSIITGNDNSVRTSSNGITVNPLQQTEYMDDYISSVCNRNAIADITYYHPDYVIRSIESNPVNRFPFLFTKKTKQIHADNRAFIDLRLKTGQSLPQRLFHEDWVIGILLTSVVLFSIVRATTKNFLPGTTRFFLFRGTKEEGSRDILGIFQWQTTFLNLSSFFVIALFAYFAASFFKIIPSEVSGFAVWLISVGIIISALTVRHFVCVSTGILSGQTGVFQDYIHTIYQSYRFGALFLFLLVIMMSYTSILPNKSYFILGVISTGFLYLIRILRLFIIFINRNISIFYLILYLCALEFLPALMVVKYFSGLA